MSWVELRLKSREGERSRAVGKLEWDVRHPPPQRHLLLSMAAWETASALRPGRNAGNRGLGKETVPERHRARVVVP